MRCPECGVEVKPAEVDLEFETAQYDCAECKTSWHVEIGAVTPDGYPRFTVQDGSTWWWLVTFETDPSFIPQRTVPGRRLAMEAVAEFMTKALEWDSIGDSTHLEVSASADPQHPETEGPGMSVYVRIEVTSAEGTVDERAQRDDETLESYEQRLATLEATQESRLLDIESKLE